MACEFPEAGEVFTQMQDEIANYRLTRDTLTASGSGLDDGACSVLDAQSDVSALL